MPNLSHLDILPIPALRDNYIWAIINKKNQSVVVVDPGDAVPVQAFLQEFKLTLHAILLTHHHWDHTNGVRELSAKHKIQVIGPAKDNIDLLTLALHEPDEINLEPLSVRLQILDIPGHTLGHIAFYAKGFLFCGDTLFAAGCGRVFEGTPSQMAASLQKITALPDDTFIYCAHEYTLNNLRFAKTVEPNNAAIHKRMNEVKSQREKNLPSLPVLLRDERETNPFLRCDAAEVKASVEAFAGKVLDNEVEVFTYLRKWKDTF